MRGRGSRAAGKLKDGDIVAEVNLHDTFDAEIWVQEWMKTIKKHPLIPTDEGSMLGWFANAIMAGYDHAYRQMQTADEEESAAGAEG